MIRPPDASTASIQSLRTGESTAGKRFRSLGLVASAALNTTPVSRVDMFTPDCSQWLSADKAAEHVGWGRLPAYSATVH